MREIITERLILRAFRETDLDDLFEYLYQLRDDEFEGYPGVTRENCLKHLNERVGSEEYYAVELKTTGKGIGNIYCGKRDFGARSGLYRQRRLPAAGLRERGADCRDRRTVPHRRAPRIRRVRSSKRALLEAARKRGAEARGASAAERILPQKRTRRSDLEGYVYLRETA